MLDYIKIWVNGISSCHLLGEVSSHLALVECCVNHSQCNISYKTLWSVHYNLYWICCGQQQSAIYKHSQCLWTSLAYPDHFFPYIGWGKGSGATPIAVYFCASPRTGDTNWITLAAKGGTNDVESIANAGWPACLFIHTSLCGQSYLISIPSAWGCAEVNSYWSCTKPFFPTQYTGKSGLDTRDYLWTAHARWYIDIVCYTFSSSSGMLILNLVIPVVSLFVLGTMQLIFYPHTVL